MVLPKIPGMQGYAKRCGLKPINRPRQKEIPLYAGEIMLQKRVLITGIPGSGKTHIGKIFQEQHGYALEDIEGWQGRDEEFLKGGNIDQERVDYEIMSKVAQNDKVVAVFGFRPLSLIDRFIVERLKGKWDFRLFWFDGNQSAALRAYFGRELERYDKGKLEPEFYDRIKGFFIQVENIRKSRVVEIIQPIHINPFQDSGAFKKEVEIVSEMMWLVGETVSNETKLGSNC